MPSRCRGRRPGRGLPPGDQAITPQEIKDLLGISRKYAIPLLEWLDAQRLTVRVGDKRVLREGATSPG